ncbi:regulator of chromosome condensation-like [Homarus americanus]|uniref:regulator of chromosome condensation-like n=1 Tax=Homarus americanus TaxID=6706 RepID=UPI001C480F82|nr:regulator of chromosome condensation-like [Homarus americanus]XP_042227473.1 regulator of chromosome condensation-like [Homarus americanus]XP_042227474.1 regulator of chromosome condensation-like [Homarus americanus]
MVRSRSAAKAATQEVKVNGEVSPKVPKGRGRKRGLPTKDSPEIKKMKMKLEAPNVENGVVLTVGMGDIGQLGLGPDVDEKTRPAVVPNLTDIVAIAAGGLHSVALDKAGKVHTWGCNDEGGLGRQTPNDEANFTSGSVDIDGKVVQISAGDCHTAALLEDGRVFAWGCFRDNNGALGLLDKGSIQKTPRQLLEGVPIIKVSSGNNHLVLLAHDGRVFTCGCGEAGQLGRIAEAFANRDSRNRKGIEILLNPQPLKVFKNRKAVLFDDVWAGGLGTFVRARGTGDVYAFGLNNYNQLGDEDTNLKFQPVLVKNFAGKIWEQMSVGQHHSLATTEDGTAHCMGRREYGRLGMGDLDNDIKKPTPITSLVGKKAISVSAGECVSLVIMESGDVYAFGMGTNNQLAQGDEEDQLLPVKMGGKQLAERRVVAAQAGGQHTLLLAIAK